VPVQGATPEECRQLRISGQDQRSGCLSISLNGPCATKIYQKRLGCLELTKRLFCRAYFERSLSKAIAEENRSKG